MKQWMIIFCLLSGAIAYGAKPKNLNIVFIGNSISAGALLKDAAKECPPVKACEYLRGLEGIGEVVCENQAVSGQTTADFLPAFRSRYPRVIAAADKLAADRGALLVFSIMLGTNDSAIKGPNGAPVRPKQYQTNLSVIIDHLLARYPGCVVILHRPLWYSENAYNNGAMYLKEGLQRLEKYYPELEVLVENYAQSHPGRVYLGDTLAFDYFREHAESLFNHEKGNAGVFFLHPNKEGAARLGEFWGKAIEKVVCQ